MNPFIELKIEKALEVYMLRVFGMRWCSVCKGWKEAPEHSHLSISYSNTSN